MTENLAHRYSSESTQPELSDEYQHDRVKMVFKNHCVLALWMKVASALEGLIVNYLMIIFLLFRQLKESRTKFGTLKRNQNTEKKKNAQLLEEARKREGSMTDDTQQLKVTSNLLMNAILSLC